MKIAVAMLAAGIPAAGDAQSDPRRTSGFPLDFDHPNNGLPFSEDPRDPPPQQAPYAAGPSIDLTIEAAKAATTGKGFTVGGAKPGEVDGRCIVAGLEKIPSRLR